ncbi:MAG: DNA primase [Planctomycetota bacterium]
MVSPDLRGHLCPAGQALRVALSNLMDFDLKDRVRQAVDLVDVIGASLTLVPKGRMLAARCPWHDDRSPSLTVNRERQTWKCWVCDIGGDVFSFVMRREGVDFPTALRLLADQAGIEYQVGPKAKPGSPNDKATLLAAVKLVSDAYYRCLEEQASDDAKIALEYLHSRGFDDEHRKLFRIGFAPDQWDFATGLLRKNKHGNDIAVAAGVAQPRQSGNGAYDFFRGRLMFPIHDMQDRPISMGGRVLPAIAERHDGNVGGKYINGPETKLFRKSKQLYGLQLAREAIRKDGQALVMEGYTDVIAAHQAGIEPVVAVLGTALGDAHVKELGRWASRVVLVLDGDEAGQRRADQVLELFVRADADLRVLTLPDGMDPADYLAQFGRESFQQLVSDAPDALEHKLNQLSAGVDIARDTHLVMKAIDSMTGLMAKSTSMDPLRRSQVLLALKRRFGIEIHDLEDRLLKKQAEERSRTQRAAQYQTRPRIASPNQVDPNQLLAEAVDEFDASPIATPRREAPAYHAEPLAGFDLKLFEILVESPGLAARAVEIIDPDWLHSMTAKMLLSAYQELDLSGRELDVESLLLLLENDFLKNEVVSLQFRVSQSEGKITQTVEERFQALLDQFHRRQEDAEKERQIARIESSSLDEDEEIELLKQLFDGEKDRQRFER